MKTLLIFFISLYGLALNGEIQKPVQEQVEVRASGFDEIWQAITAKNPEIKAIEKEKSASMAQADAASSALLPQLYLSGQSLATDNPTVKFMGILNQRQVNQSDFMPSQLTNHDWQIIHQFSIGMRLPIYEGGSSRARNTAYKSAAEAKDWQGHAVKNHLYFQTASSYGLLIILREQETAVKALNERIHSLIDKYRLGNKNNPVGYSGLLGLKNLIIQLEAINTEIVTESQIHMSTLAALSGSDSLIIPNKGQELAPFLKKQLEWETLSSQTKHAKNPKVLALKKAYDAATAEVEAINAMYKPQFSAFAETGATAGARETQASSSVGLALTWTLYDGAKNENINAGRSNAAALNFRADGEIINNQLEMQRLQQQLNALKQGESLLKNSELLLEDQINVSLNLFRNGVINVLPVVEIFSHKVSLLQQQFTNEKKLLQTQAGLWLAQAQ